MIPRSEIIGQVIVKMVFKYQRVDGWLNSCSSFLLLGNKRILWFAHSHIEELSVERIPSFSKRFSRDIRKKVEGRTITEVYRQIDNGKAADASIVVQLGDGTLLYEESMVPVGIGSVGLCVLEKDEPLDSLEYELIPFWD